MSHVPGSSPNAGPNHTEGIPNLSEFSFHPFKDDFFQHPTSSLPLSVISIQSPLSIEKILDLTHNLQKANIILPHFETVANGDLISGASGTTLLITPPQGPQGEPHFNPSYLRALIGRELHESELTLISLVTRSIAREVIKILDIESDKDSTTVSAQGQMRGGSAVLMSGKLEDYLISVPRFDPIHHEMVCNATYIGFGRDPLSGIQAKNLGPTDSSSDPVLSALQELFVDAICSLYTSKDTKPIRWGQILANPGVYAVLEGIITACNENNLMEYSSRVCGFTHDDSLLKRMQTELERRWKRYQISDIFPKN